MVTGQDLVGGWSFNGNGSSGAMTIFNAVDNGEVNLRVGFSDVNREDRWTGRWRPEAREIVLTRELPDGVTQTYTGHLGDNHPPHLIFGGSFTQSEAGATEFGWFAEWMSILIV